MFLPRRPSSGPCRVSGFTLIELVVTLAIVAVLVVITIPSFRLLIDRQRVVSEVNSFVADLRYARSEALKRGLSVSICPSTTGTTCLGQNNWSGGWIVFADANGSGTIDGTGDPVLRIRPGWTSGDTFSASPSLTAITFTREGMAMNLAAVTMPLRTSPAATQTTRCIALNPVGRHTIESPGTGACS